MSGSSGLGAPSGSSRWCVSVLSSLRCAEQPLGSSGRSFLRRGSSKALQASYELVGSVVLEGNAVVRLVRGLQMTWLPARHMMFLPAELDEVMQERPGRFGSKI